MCLNQARYGIAWGGIGAAMECYYTALEYAKQRVQWNGQPIACHQLVQEKLVWMVSEITKGQLLCLQLGRLKDAGRLKAHHISLGKRNNVWVALGVRQAGARDPGGERHRRRLPGDPAHAQHRVRLHLRGDARHPRPDPRRGDHRHPGVQRADARRPRLPRRAPRAVQHCGRGPATTCQPTPTPALVGEATGGSIIAGTYGRSR